MPEWAAASSGALGAQHGSSTAQSQKCPLEQDCGSLALWTQPRRSSQQHCWKQGCARAWMGTQPSPHQGRSRWMWRWCHQRPLQTSLAMRLCLCLQHSLNKCHVSVSLCKTSFRKRQVKTGLHFMLLLQLNSSPPGWCVSNKAKSNHWHGLSPSRAETFVTSDVTGAHPCWRARACWVPPFHIPAPSRWGRGDPGVSATFFTV